MPWRELSVMDQREEFVTLALGAGANKSELCRRFGISRQQGYKWLRRYEAEGQAGLADRSRRPRHSPGRTSVATEAEVLRIRAANKNVWCGRKIARALRDAGWGEVPAASTISEILRRHGKLEERAREHPGPFQRFERKHPNELWQMDFKGHFATLQGRCHPLTVVDDHSRYALEIGACSNEQDTTVRQRLGRAFRRYGLPVAMLMDNGAPWGDAGDQPYTVFTAWLIRLGVRVIHGRPLHPQTQGKCERFHRTLNAEVIQGTSFRDLAHCQSTFDRWRHVYNYERPHDALGLSTPSTRYRASPRPFPEQLPPIEYGPGDIVRRVGQTGHLSFMNRRIRVGKAFRHHPVALRPTRQDGVLTVHFCTQQIGTIDLRQACGFVDIASSAKPCGEVLDAMPTSSTGPTATTEAIIT
jgi:transposase InsO family protein